MLHVLLYVRYGFRRRQERLELGEAVALIEAVKNIFREEDNMVALDAPVRMAKTAVYCILYSKNCF